MRRRDFLAAAAAGAVVPLTSAAGPPSSNTGLSLNEDNSHYFFTRAGQSLDADRVSSFVDQYAGTQVREFLLSANAMRTSYASEVWDPIWRGYDPTGPDDQPLLSSTAPDGRKGARAWVHTAWQLHQQGLDPYRLWIARLRRHRISPWVSMRMNDLHAVDDDRNFMHSEFWRKHPEYRRVPWRTASWQDRALDFAHPEVRAYNLKLVRELANRYDIDGLELDWMRFPYHFAPGREREGGQLLTGFVREVRAILDTAGARRGRRIRLGARVPSRPQTAIAMGLDGAQWAQLGFLDMLVATPFFSSIETDLPVELWRRLLPARVTLAAGLELNIRPYHAYPPQPNSLEAVRGAAAAMLARGVDRVYLFNYMDSQTAMRNLDEYQPVLRECGSLATLAGKPRRHIVTYSDTYAPGEPTASALPKSPRAAGEWFSVRAHTGPAWKSAEVRLACQGPRPDELRVNGVACEYAGLVPAPAPNSGITWPREEFHAWKAVNGAGRETVIDARAAGPATIHWVEVAVAAAG